MKQEMDRVGRSWIEEHGGTIFGIGVFVLLGLIVVIGLFCK